MQNQITLEPLDDLEEARELAEFYLTTAKSEAGNRRQHRGQRPGKAALVTDDEIERCFPPYRGRWIDHVLIADATDIDPSRLLAVRAKL